GNPIPDLTVTFSTGESGNVHNNQSESRTTNASGVATFSFTDTDPQGTGPDRWTAKVNEDVEASEDIEWRAAAPAWITLDADVTQPKAGEQVTLTATVYDAHGNVVDWFGDKGEKIFFR